MGRGRQKAKQTKKARELKYSSPATDFNALQRELSGSSEHGDAEYDDDYQSSTQAAYSPYSDPYEDDEDDWAPKR